MKGALIAGLLFPLQSAARRKREIELWSARLCYILGVRIFLHGSPPAYDLRPLMIVANHVSWLDIFAINAVVPVRFVAKAEVRRWPLVGWLSARAGTIFINRARRQDTLRINGLIVDALRAGELFAVFPEGTTSDGSRLLKFHSSLLEPALQAGAAVQPVALRYEREDGSLCTEAAYDGAQIRMGFVDRHRERAFGHRPHLHAAADIARRRQPTRACARGMARYSSDAVPRSSEQRH